MSDKRKEFVVGDIFEIKLEENLYGYGRILVKKNNDIYIEVFNMYSNEPRDQVEDPNTENPFYMIWTGTIGLKKGIWKKVGHVPLEKEFEMPATWLKHPFEEDRYFLRKNGTEKVVTKDEIGDAQPDGSYNIEAVRVTLLAKLKENGSLS